MFVAASFCVFLASLAIYGYVMARYEEFMSNREIFDLIVVTPARAVWNLAVEVIDWITGFCFGPVELLFFKEAGSYDYAKASTAFDYGRFSFQVAACAGSCLVMVGSGMAVVGGIIGAAYKWLVG